MNVSNYENKSSAGGEKTQTEIALGAGYSVT
jgi:hypothetical protein